MKTLLVVLAFVAVILSDNLEELTVNPICCDVTQEVVAGTVVVESRGECAHQGITLAADGSVSLQLSSKSVGVFEAFYNSVKVRPKHW